jgi:hypothetical protein
VLGWHSHRMYRAARAASVEPAGTACQSASKIGSDSDLMKFAGGLAQISVGESASWHRALRFHPLFRVGWLSRASLSLRIRSKSRHGHARFKLR